MSLAPAAATPDPGPRRGQSRQRVRECLVEEAQARKSRPYPGNGSSSRIQCGAVTGPPYLANFRQRLCPAAPASLRALLALLLQTLGSRHASPNVWIGSVWRLAFERPANVRASEPKGPTNEATRASLSMPSTADCESILAHILCVASVASRF